MRVRNNILKITFLLILTSAVLYSEVITSVVATVGNLPITSMDFASRKKYLNAMARMQGKRITDEDVYKDLITEKILDLKAREYKIEILDREIQREIDRIRESNNIANMADFEKAIAEQGMDIDEYKASIRKQMIMQNLYGLAIKPVEVSNEDADAYYAKSKGDERKYFEIDTSVQVGWIFFAAKTFGEKSEKSKLANTVQAQAAKQSNFASLAAQYSDDRATKNNGGNLGYYSISDISTRRLPTHITTLTVSGDFQECRFHKLRLVTTENS